MTEKIRSQRTKKKNLVLMGRDLEALVELNQHRAISSSQLFRLCFSEISYETARKRLRRLNQAGYIGASSSSRMEGRGRPELVYFLTATSAKVLNEHRGIALEQIPVGPPHLYHKEHFLRLVDIRLSLGDAERVGIINSFNWSSGKEFWKEVSPEEITFSEHADATIAYSFPGQAMQRVLLEMDTGNFRQHRHWEPKLRSFLRIGCQILVVSASISRIMTLRKWTMPLLEEFAVSADKCIFAVYSEIVDHGLFQAQWFSSDGKIVQLSELKKSFHNNGFSINEAIDAGKL